MSTPIYEGFWLPEPLRAAALGPGTEYETAWFRDGLPADEASAAVGVRWPVLQAAQWESLLNHLGDARASALSASTAAQRAERWQAALAQIPAALLERLSLDDLSQVTGFSPAMLAFALRALQWTDPRQLAAAAQLELDPAAGRRFVPLAPLPGLVRFYPVARGPFAQKLALRRQDTAFVAGFAAGNVIGGALLPIFLAQLAVTGAPPAILMKNSRHEALFTPLVLSAVAQVDPDLTAAVAVMIWDYSNAALQRLLLGRAGLVLAAADDATLAEIGRYVPATARYHQHGHKVSFTTIDRAYASGRRLPLESLAGLAALDSVFWDQYGCLSSRIHFVEGPAEEYTQALLAAMRSWESALPRGRASLRQQHARFDRYKSLQPTGQVRVLSQYDEPFLVVLDQRPPDRAAISGAANDALERTVFVRPVADVMEVPSICLATLPPRSLQSMSVAMDQDRLLPFAEAAGARGVTAIRAAGRGAFPGLAHSWDGLLPLDFAGRRPDGYFTTLDFDDLAETLRQNLEWTGS